MWRRPNNSGDMRGASWRNQRVLGGSEGGAQVGPRLYSQRRMPFLGEQLMHTPTVGGEVDSGCYELRGVGSCHPMLPRCCELTPSSLPNTSSASQAQRALSGCQEAEQRAQPSTRADGWQPQTHPPVNPRVPFTKPLWLSTAFQDTVTPIQRSFLIQI